MAISFVGSASGSSSPNADTTITLPTLAIGDLILVAAMVADTVENHLAEPTGGGAGSYSLLGSNYANDVNDTNFDIFFKFAVAGDSGATITFADVGGANASNAAVCMVFRGISIGDPFAGGDTTASGISSSSADPPSLDHENPSGVWVVAIGATAHTGGNTATFTAPTGYTTDFVQRAHNDTIDALIGMGYRSSGVSDPEDPGVFTPATIGTAADNSWCAATLALRPLKFQANTGSLSFVGTDTERTNKVLAGTLSFIGALTKRTHKVLSGALSFIGNLATQFIGGGTTFEQAVNGTLSFIGTTTKQTSHLLSGALSFIGSFVKQTNRPLAATSTLAGALSEQTNSIIAAVLTFSGTMSKQTNKALSGVSSFIGSLTKQTNKMLSGVLSFIGALASEIVTEQTFFQAVDGTLSFVGNTVKSTNRLLDGTLSFIGNMTKRVGKVLAGVLSFVGNMSKQTNKLLTAVLSFVGAVTKHTSKGLVAALSFVGDMTKHTSRALEAALSFAGDMLKQTGKVLAGTVTFFGLDEEQVRKGFSAALTFTGSTSRHVSKALAGTLSFASDLVARFLGLLRLSNWKVVIDGVAVTHGPDRTIPAATEAVEIAVTAPVAGATEIVVTQRAADSQITVIG